ncbi:MAG: BMP family ABC transporter substrate-binding protein, partial [Clostridia bacterium]|nr:BMP family ABC transporter substrate-binding protein [Clostridia bacterium]
GGIAEGSVVLTGVNQDVAAEGTVAKIKEVVKGFADGTVKVFDTKTFTVEGKELTSYVADVDDKGDYVPDTEVVENGVFNESVKRSAPYFDLKVDGITRLNEKF